MNVRAGRLVLVSVAAGAVAAVGCAGGNANTRALGTGGATPDKAGTGGAGSGGSGTGGQASGGSGAGGIATGGAGTGGAGSSGAAGALGAGGQAGGGMSGTGAAGAGGASDLTCPGPRQQSGGTLCRTNADCPSPSGAYRCTSDPGAITSICGSFCASPPIQQCTDDSGCAAGSVCLPMAASCCDRPNHLCMPACTATSCQSTERCNSAGHCELNPCADGYTCPGGTVCMPGTTGADANGCAPQSCAGGYTCPSGQICALGVVGVDGHGCGPVPCSQSGCPINSVCNPSAVVGGCTVKTCTTDGDCGCAYCVNGACAASLSTCALIPS